MMLSGLSSVPVGLSILAGIVTTAYLFFCPSYQRQMNESVVKENDKYPRDDTLIPLLKAKCVPMHELYRRGFGPLLEIVRVLIGVVPKCDEYLEIWPAAFRSYNLMVPNFFNIPIFTLQLGNVYKEASLAMYIASRVASCSYCSAHTCSYAARRGNALQMLKAAMTSSLDETNLSEKDKAVVSFARGLGRVPSTLQEKDTLLKYYSPSDVEWIACGAIGMGFLNKVMDSIGVELEKNTYLEAKAVMGSNYQAGKAGVNVHNLATSGDGSGAPQNDTLWTRLYHLRYIPGAILWELKTTWGLGITSNANTNCAKLEQICGGYGFPVLKKIQNPRIVFSVAALIRENLSETGENNIPVPTKVLLGICFARVIGDKTLEDGLSSMTFDNNLPSPADKDAVKKFADEGTLDKKNPLLTLAKAISPSPAQVTPDVVDLLKGANVPAEQVVEVVSLLAVLQLLHRLMAFYPAPYE